MRKLADAFSQGTWLFKESDGYFELNKFITDQDYDEIVDPRTILDLL